MAQEEIRPGESARVRRVIQILREGGRAKHAPSEVDPSAQLRLAAPCLSSRSSHPCRRSGSQRQPRGQNVPPDRMRNGCLEPTIERRHKRWQSHASPPTKMIPTKASTPASLAHAAPLTIVFA